MGDPLHCNSFHQRWQGFCDALDEAGLALDKGLCMIEEDSPLYSDEDWLAKWFQGLMVRRSLPWWSHL